MFYIVLYYAFVFFEDISPFLGKDFRYWNIRVTTFMWSSLGLCIKYLTTLIVYAISGRALAYQKNLWYLSLYVGTYSGYFLRWWFCTIGASTGFHSNIPTLVNKSNTYFLWERIIPCLKLGTSISRCIWVLYVFHFKLNCQLFLNSWYFIYINYQSSYLVQIKL